MVLSRVLLRADQIQPREDFARVSADAATGSVARLIRAGLDALDASIDGAALAQMIRESRFDAMWRHLALERVGNAIRPALNRLAIIHDKSAIEATAAIFGDFRQPATKARPTKITQPTVSGTTYDPLDSATVAAQNADNQQIIDDLTAQAQANAEAVITAGLKRGDSPETIARSLRDTLAMSAQESTAIENYRAMLQSNPASTAARVLRDRRYDATVRRGELSETQIDTIVARYAARYRSFRALRLARTEALRAANQGRAAAYAQYKALTGRDYRRFWLTAGDELVCPICSVIPGLNPDGIGADDDYTTPIGPIHAPPDPHPNCRCSERFQI